MSGLGWNRSRQASLQPGLVSPLNRAIKRIFDIVITVLLLATLIPIFAVVCLLIKLDGGPIFSARERTGLDGRTFKCLRFRTTICSGDSKLKDDPLVSKIGDFLRVTGIDALPQFINVLRGEMSLVGSGPQLDALNKHNGDDRRYPNVRPGLTGLWRVRSDHHSNDSSNVCFDDQYVRDWSLWVDISILIRSIPDVVTAAPRSTNSSREQ
jgi:lipopolysaccharide/colanic/teichoic acid biosynthesis glycosyltransferase